MCLLPAGEERSAEQFLVGAASGLPCYVCSLRGAQLHLCRLAGGKPGTAPGAAAGTRHCMCKEMERWYPRPADGCRKGARLWTQLQEASLRAPEAGTACMPAACTACQRAAHLLHVAARLHCLRLHTTEACKSWSEAGL